MGSSGIEWKNASTGGFGPGNLGAPTLCTSTTFTWKGTTIMAIYTGYEDHYSEGKFRGFIGRAASRFPSIRQAVAMFYTLKDPSTPAWAKAVIVAVLGYVVCPMDVIPDPLPGGLIDDVAAVGAAYALIGHLIPNKHWKKADRILGSG